MNSNSACSIGGAERRWACVGPYYAMFPIEDVVNIVRKYSDPGDVVVDPFAGRFSVPAVASYMGRIGYGIEISPLGWLYGRVKQYPAQRFGDVDTRLAQMGEIAEQYRSESRCMGEFFESCYSPRVRRFLLACRDNLQWTTSRVDGTLMACLLVVLHHGIGRGLSNQMRQTKAMSPRYAVRWWKDRGMGVPPNIDPVRLLRSKIRWRYAQGIFKYSEAVQVKGDSCIVLGRPNVRRQIKERGGAKLLFTSPPYSGLVNYFKDQWIRLWMLGDEASPRVREHHLQKNFADKTVYRHVIGDVFEQCASLMRDDGIIVVRVDTRKFTFDTVMHAIKASFPEYTNLEEPRYSYGNSQTRLYNLGEKGYDECDLVLAHRRQVPRSQC